MLPADADWDAVATAITTRLDELKMAQKMLAELSKVSPATIRQLQRNYTAKERNPRTLEALSLALRWPADHLAKVADPATAPDNPGRALEVEVAQLRTDLAALQARVDALEQQDHS